jgi:hypothetical protein
MQYLLSMVGDLWVLTGVAATFLAAIMQRIDGYAAHASVRA